MGRREERDAIQSTWRVYEPREPGTPFRKRDLEATYAKELPPEPAVESSEASVAPRCPRDSAAGSEGG